MLQEILDIPDVVCMRNNLYVKTPAALERLLEVLRGIGYTIEDVRERYARLPRELPLLSERLEGRYCLWGASLDIGRAKCGTCKQYISRMGIFSDNHRCECCGSVTYLQPIEGSYITFSFAAPSNEAHSLDDLTLKVQRWDRHEEWVYFYPELLKGTWTTREADLATYFHANSDKWDEVEEDGQKLIRIRLPKDYDKEGAVIRVTAIVGSYSNATTMKVWQGREYGDIFDEDLPVATSISIYESWLWSPLPSSPLLYERVLSVAGKVSREGFYPENGSPQFSLEDFAHMGVFIRHFTALDADEWDKRSQTFRLDAVGAIADIRHFCDPTFVLPPVPKRTRAAGHGWMVINYDLKDPTKE